LIINFQVSRSRPSNRVKYLLEGTKNKQRDKSKIEILEGNAELFLEKASLNTYKTKSFNFLISFAESREELEKKLSKRGKTIQDVYDEVIEQITKGYSKDELNILSIGHADTDNYHIHITIDSRNQLTDTQLYFQAPRKNYKSLEVELWRTLEEYINKKYGLISNTLLFSKGKALNEKIKEILDKRGEYREKTRDAIKEEITKILSMLIISEGVNSRDELVDYLKSIEGIEINRVGKGYISIKYRNFKLRLKGGIYSDEGFKRIKREIEGTQKTDRESIQRELAELEERINEIQRKRIQRIEKRFKTARERAKRIKQELIKEIEEYNFATKPNNHYILNDSRDRSRTIQLSKNQKSDTSSSVISDRKRQMGQQDELPRDKGPNPLLLHRQKMEKSKNGYLPYSSISEKLKKTIMNYEEKRKEELETIKSIDPEIVISDLRIPCTKRPSYYECRAIWRGDKNPSLSIFRDNNGIWRWKDHATDEKGTWIDLYMVAKNWDYITAVKYLRENLCIACTQKFIEKNSFSSQLTVSKDYQLISVKEKSISKDVIKRFLREYRKIRHIPSWLKEVEYKILDIETGEVFKYFGFGVKDEAGNYHIRYATDKAKVKERVIGFGEDGTGSTYAHIKKGSHKVVVVEGFIDAIRIEEMDQFKDSDIIILNGVENIKKALEQLKKYKVIFIATDMDNAGDKVANIVVKNTTNQKIYRLEFSAKDIDEAVKHSKEIRIKNITVENNKNIKPRL